MRDDAMKRLRYVNPVPGTLAAPPIEPLLRRLDEQPEAALNVAPGIEGADRRAGGRRRLRRPSVGALAAGALIALTLAIAAGALIVLGNHNRAALSGPAAASRQELVDMLAVLRRPQRPSDLQDPSLQHYLKADLDHYKVADTSLIRFATITPWGAKVFLVPLKPRTNIPSPNPRFGQETLIVAPSSVSRPLGIPAGRIAAGEMLSVDDDGSGGSRVVLVVPDGVTSVKLLISGQAMLPDRFYPRALVASAPVHHNVAAFAIPRSPDFVVFRPEIWYGAGGKVVKRIAHPSSLTGVVSPTKPAPETPLSRRAERDPSTPNPVSITPNVGPPGWAVTITFRRLLNRGTYLYRFTAGPRSPGCYSPVGRPPDTVDSGPGDIRGQISSIQFENSNWCPGTYHVAVSLSGHSPFGTAKFTVLSEAAGNGRTTTLNTTKLPPGTTSSCDLASRRC